MTFNKLRLAMLCIIVLWMCSFDFLLAAEGGYGFLKMVSDARSRALGGAFTGVLGELECVFHNPAGLLEMEKRSGYVTSYSRYWEDSYMGSFAHVWEGNGGKWGVGLKYFNSGKMDKTFINSDGSFGGYGGEFSTASGVFFLTFAHSLNEMLDFSLRPFVAWQSVDEETGTAMGIDVSLLHITPNELFSLGASLQNVGYSLQNIGEEQESPDFWGRVGLATTPKLTQYALISAEMAMPQNNDSYFCGGLEVYPAALFGVEPKTFALAAGYNGLSQNWTFDDDVAGGLSLGFAYNGAPFNLHYTFEFCGEMDAVHTLQFSKAIR